MTISLPFTNNTVSLPAPVACMLFTASAVLLAQAGLWFFNRWRNHAKLEQGNEVAGILFGAIGLIYSLILTFVIVAVWEDYNALDKTVKSETDKLNGILAHSSALPDSLKNLIGGSIYDYCSQVTQREWQMQKTETDYPSAIPVLRQQLLTTQPANNMQARVFEVIDENLSRVTELRRARLSHTHSQLPPLIWQILVVGTGLLILFSYFLHVPSVKLKRIYLTFFVTTLSMSMFLVQSLDHPFDERDGVSKQPYYDVKEESKAYLPTQAKEQMDLSYLSVNE